MRDFLDKRLLGIKGVASNPPMGAESSEAIDVDLGIKLPQTHKDFLRITNGIEVYYGYFRVFGVNTNGPLDLERWNRESYWKFAWGNRCSRFCCFAETVWGDQYAYSTDLLSGAGRDRVFCLEAHSMTPEVIAESFAEFVRNELVRQATAPYDIMTVEAQRKFGPITTNTHLVFVPSILIGGSESVDSVVKMDARAAMICNGDVATQVDVLPDGANITGVEPFEDSQGRTRIRLVVS